MRDMTRTDAEHLLSSYDYHVPKSLIATHPKDKRDDSRLLALTHNGISHTYFRRLSQIIPRNSLLIVNDSKVVPSAISGVNRRNGRTLDLTFIENDGKERTAFVMPAKYIEQGDILTCGNYALQNLAKDGAQSRFAVIGNDVDFVDLLASEGRPALPPYIVKERKKRGDNAFSDDDISRYQTIFANNDGSLAAPTAGLHFTDDILQSLTNRGCNVVKVTLHVGLGTFAPVKTDDVRNHVMHQEEYMISAEAASAINAGG